MQAFFQELVAEFDWWVVFGLAGQSMFFLRFFVQWISSERAKKSVMPVAFWYFSIAGAIIVFIYGIQEREIVLIVGQAVGMMVYLRNLYLIWRHRRLEAMRPPESPLVYSAVTDEPRR